MTCQVIARRPLWATRTKRFFTQSGLPISFCLQAQRCIATETRQKEYHETTDLLIVGSGGAGLTAALRAHSLGLKPLLVEKLDKIGGTTSYSGGALWIPNNHVSKAAGVKDDLKDALRYLNELIGDATLASSEKRRIAFLENGPKMVSFLADEGLRWHSGTAYPDYHPQLPGGVVGGRSISPEVFNVRELGPWEKRLLDHPWRKSAPIHMDEFHILFLSMTSPGAFWRLLSLLYARLSRMFGGQVPRTMGTSLVAQLLLLNFKHQTQIYCRTPLVRLLVEDGSVMGAVVNRNGKEINIRARKGVLLTAGGFSQNAQMKKEYQKGPVDVYWSHVAPGDTGDGIRAGMEIGSDVALMKEAWYTPTLVNPANGHKYFCFERSLPHSIMVDASGERFVNEAAPYNDIGRQYYTRNAKVNAIPAWLIFDSTHRGKYFFAEVGPRYTPASVLSSGFLTKADTLEALAEKIQIRPTGLRATVDRFNPMAIKGVDEDFGRGSSPYDNYFGDPLVKPNPNLGTIAKPPFYAARVYPGDIGTKGGLLADEYARVIHRNGQVIPGLYAAGNTTASVMGHRYAGAGATLGPALTFAFIAVNHIAGLNGSPSGS